MTVVTSLKCQAGDASVLTDGQSFHISSYYATFENNKKNTICKTDSSGVYFNLNEQFSTFIPVFIVGFHLAACLRL